MNKENLKPQTNIFISKGHVKPIRFYVRDGKSVRALFDLQIKSELRHLDNPLKQEHSLSVYIKPPTNVHYQLATKDYSIKDNGGGMWQYTLINVDESEILMNPYISWHGSGEIHATAYESISGVWKPKRIVTNRDAPGWRDVRMAYNLILRAIVPIEASPALEDNLDPNVTLDMVNKVIPKNGIKNIVLESAILVRKTVVLDVFIHNRAYNFSEVGQLPYPNESEMIWLSSPLKFENSDSIFAPAVSLFAYQPVAPDEPSLILEGITLNHPHDDIYVSAKYTEQGESTIESSS